MSCERGALHSRAASVCWLVCTHAKLRAQAEGRQAHLRHLGSMLQSHQRCEVQNRRSQRRRASWMSSVFSAPFACASFLLQVEPLSSSCRPTDEPVQRERPKRTCQDTQTSTAGRADATRQHLELFNKVSQSEEAILLEETLSLAVDLNACRCWGLLGR